VGVGGPRGSVTIIMGGVRGGGGGGRLGMGIGMVMGGLRGLGDPGEPIFLVVEGCRGGIIE